jgi:hypothetical protein
MAQRRITLSEIEEALANPGTTYPSKTHSDRTVVMSDLATGKRLKVVVLTADPGTVITASDRDLEG